MKAVLSDLNKQKNQELKIIETVKDWSGLQKTALHDYMRILTTRSSKAEKSEQAPIGMEMYFFRLLTLNHRTH